eukprot:11211533-Heterocapsa_arctica.AAC.1
MARQPARRARQPARRGQAASQAGRQASSFAAPDRPSRQPGRQAAVRADLVKNRRAQPARSGSL